MSLKHGILFSFALLVSCNDDPESDPPMVQEPGSPKLTEAFPDLSFTRPVDLQADGQGNLYIVEQSGTIRSFQNEPTVSVFSLFLDIKERVNDQGNEQGLLGLAFHPQFNTNGLFFVNYTSNNETTRISRFMVDPNDGQQADPSSEVVFMEFDQPFTNHNGGQLAFGPDQYLYIATGDGGSGGDPQRHGQDRSTLLGNILRIDVDAPSGMLQYSIPEDNPFKDNQMGYQEEIFAYGFRNPWRMSFDPDTGELWVADVGQNEFEEVNIVSNGGNYGWNQVEGPQCFISSDCDQSLFEGPYFSYDHSNGNVSITGGYVYRGGLNLLEGKYVFADYQSGRIWALESHTANPQNELLIDSELHITTFGVDATDELYVCGQNGKIYKFIE